MNWYSKSQQPDLQKIIDLKKVARSIRHCGDYGVLFWHAKSNKVRWVMGDADGMDRYDSSDLIERKFKKLPFVKTVEIEAEVGWGETNGWKRIKY